MMALHPDNVDPGMGFSKNRKEKCRSEEIKNGELAPLAKRKNGCIQTAA